MTAIEHPVVVNFLKHLEGAAQRLPSQQASELLADIKEHLREALSGVTATDEPRIRAIVDTLGDPTRSWQLRKIPPRAEPIISVPRPQRCLRIKVGDQSKYSPSLG